MTRAEASRHSGAALCLPPSSTIPSVPSSRDPIPSQRQRASSLARHQLRHLAMMTTMTRRLSPRYPTRRRSSSRSRRLLPSRRAAPPTTAAAARRRVAPSRQLQQLARSASVLSTTTTTSPAPAPGRPSRSAALRPSTTRQPLSHASETPRSGVPRNERDTAPSTPTPIKQHSLADMNGAACACAYGSYIFDR